MTIVYDCLLVVIEFNNLYSTEIFSVHKVSTGNACTMLPLFLKLMSIRTKTSRKRYTAGILTKRNPLHFSFLHTSEKHIYYCTHLDIKLLAIPAECFLAWHVKWNMIFCISVHIIWYFVLC